MTFLFVFDSKISSKKDAYHYNPATRLLEVRREMAEVEQALVAYKEVGVCNNTANIAYLNTLNSLAQKMKHLHVYH